MRVGGKLGEGVTGPFAGVNFIEFGRDLELEIKTATQRFSGLADAFERAGKDLNNREYRQLFSQPFGLFATAGVEMNARHSAGNGDIDQVVRGVAHEQ